MALFRLAALFAVLIGIYAAAQDKSTHSEDPIVVELSKSKESYRASINAAAEKLLTAFTNQQKQIEDNSTLKVDQQIKLINQIKEEKREFLANRMILPNSASMRTHRLEYQSKMAAARKKCEIAFDKAAEDYRASKNFESAKAILDAKKDFVSTETLFFFDGIWVANHSNRWSGRRSVKGLVVDDNGTTCVWGRSGSQITVNWPGGGWEKLEIDFKNPDVLKGKTDRNLGSTWVRQKDSSPKK